MTRFHVCSWAVKQRRVLLAWNTLEGNKFAQIDSSVTELIRWSPNMHASECKIMNFRVHDP